MASALTPRNVYFDFLVATYSRANTSSVDIAATDLTNIKSRLSKVPYITQEVIWVSGSEVSPTEYTGIGELNTCPAVENNC